MVWISHSYYLGPSTLVGLTDWLIRSIHGSTFPVLFCLALYWSWSLQRTTVRLLVGAALLIRDTCPFFFTFPRGGGQPVFPFIPLRCLQPWSTFLFRIDEYKKPLSSITGCSSTRRGVFFRFLVLVSSAHPKSTGDLQRLPDWAFVLADYCIGTTIPKKQQLLHLLFGRGL